MCVSMCGGGCTCSCARPLGLDTGAVNSPCDLGKSLAEPHLSLVKEENNICPPGLLCLEKDLTCQRPGLQCIMGGFPCPPCTAQSGASSRSSLCTPQEMIILEGGLQSCGGHLAAGAKSGLALNPSLLVWPLSCTEPRSAIAMVSQAKVCRTTVSPEEEWGPGHGPDDP